jgi:hypothetical protein
MLCLISTAQVQKVVDTAESKLFRLQQLAVDDANRLTEKMEEQTEKLQQKMAKYEKKLAKACLKSDSLNAQLEALMIKAEPAYWLEKLKAKDSLLSKLGTGPYISRLDSLTGMLRFLDKDGNSAAALQSLHAIKARLGITQEYQQLLDERLSQWKQLLNVNGLVGKYLPPSFKKLQTELLTYKNQVAGWKEMLNDQQRLEQEALKWLNKLPAFQQFMQQNGELARLFGNPAASAAAGGTAAMAGLQTVQGMQQLMQQRFGSGPQAMQALQQGLQQGMSQVSQQQQMLDPINNLVAQGRQMVNNIMQQGSYGNEAITPKQEEQAALKSKTFGKRLELGWNFQTGSVLRNAPVTTDLGFSIGYKLNPRSVVGVGAAYRFGMGSLQRIRFTHEGVGLRSFIDWKVKGSWWITGGYEMNYWQRIYDLRQYRHLAWQQSGLVGVTRLLKVGKHISRMQLLFDIVAYRNKLNSPLSIRYGKAF